MGLCSVIVIALSACKREPAAKRLPALVMERAPVAGRPPTSGFAVESVLVTQSEPGSTTWKYKLKLRNHFTCAVLVNVRLECLDAAGKVVHDCVIPNVLLPASGEQTCAGVEEIPLETATRMKSARALFS